jgi:hypothetical protein
MIVGMQGSKTFTDYSVFLNAMLRVLNSFEDGDTEFTIITAGPFRVNEMAQEFVNVSDWKSRGIRAKVVKMPAIALEERMGSVDQFVYFCNPKEALGPLVKVADKHDLFPQVFRYAKQ